MCRLRTPLRTPSPGAAPTAPVALARCRWQLGASSHTCALLGLTCSNTLHVIPHEVLLPKQRLSHSQEMGGKPGGQQRMGRERRRGPAAATQPLGMERWHLEQPHTRGTLQPDGDEHLPGGRCMSKELQGLRGGGCCSREGDPGTNPASFHRSAAAISAQASQAFYHPKAAPGRFLPVSPAVCPTLRQGSRARGSLVPSASCWGHVLSTLAVRCQQCPAETALSFLSKMFPHFPELYNH